jgi:osmoprotectant transport system ATP-binding protein
MIVAEKISKSFQGVAAVKEVSFELAEGKKLALLGTSGSGKTTTLRMLNRLTELDSGRVFINGQNIFEQSPEHLRQGIGYVLQQHGLFPHYTVAENISIVPKLLQWNPKRIHERCVELLNKFQLPPGQFMNAWPDQLSGGQQQRVGLARALAADPPILLMDEPFGALDPITRASIRKEIFEFDELKLKTIVLVTHDIQEAFEIGDQICLMHEGTVVQQGTALDLLLRPINDFVHDFLKNQSLQLELKVLRIAALWPFLNDGIVEILNHQNELSSNESVWNLLELFLSKEPGEEVFVLNEERSEMKKFNAAEMFSAFNQFKKQLNHG